MNRNDIPDELLKNQKRSAAVSKPNTAAQSPVQRAVKPPVPRQSAVSSAAAGQTVRPAAAQSVQRASSAQRAVSQRQASAQSMQMTSAQRPASAQPMQRTTAQRSASAQPMRRTAAQRPSSVQSANGTVQRRAASSASQSGVRSVNPSGRQTAHASSDTRTINRVRNPQAKKEETEEQTTTVSSLVKAILYIVIVVAVAGLLSYYIIMFGNDMYAFVKSEEEVEVSIPEYATVEEIADVLGDAGVIKYPNLLVIYAKLKKIDKTYEFVAGEYTVNGMMNYDELFYAFVKHKSYETVRITIPEGYTVDEIINLMTENGIGSREKFIDVINNYEFDFDFVKALDASDLSGRTYRLEGYLYPDTYEFYKSSSEETVIYKLLSRFNVIFAEEFYNKSQELGYSIDEIMTLASMIEKEGRYSTDYEQISSVFHNRLNNSANYPYLESDATIMYAVQVRDGERKATLTSEDMNYDTPYNSYMYRGLPPGPIANPGYEAITCALYPAKTNYYFFVSDNYGNTYFSKTLAQHNEAKEKVRRINSEG